VSVTVTSHWWSGTRVARCAGIRLWLEHVSEAARLQKLNHADGIESLRNALVS